jgi:hypothetical protein
MMVGMTDLPKLTPDQGWPLTEEIPVHTDDDPVCVAHTRWFPCLTPDHRYDSPNRNCMVVRDHRCAEILRQYHQGEATLGQTNVALAKELKRGLAVKVVKNEGVIA